MLDRIPTTATANAVWAPAPNGRYFCQNGNARGALRFRLEENDADWDMAWHDLGFILKVLYDLEGTKSNAQFFDFHVNYTPDSQAKEAETVMSGSWDS